MLNNKDFDFRRADYLVIDLMWKSTEQTTPDHASNAWERLRVSGDPLNIFIKLFEEFNGHFMSCLGLIILQDFCDIFSCEYVITNPHLRRYSSKDAMNSSCDSDISGFSSISRLRR